MYVVTSNLNSQPSGFFTSKSPKSTALINIMVNSSKKYTQKKLIFFFQNVDP
jgi:hypothetical protein